MVTVRVPATTANIGPGFDTFGCALALYNTFTFEEIPAGLQFAGCEEAYCNEENLAVVAYRCVMDALGLPMTGLSITMETQIPICRGLGSSASLIAAGAAAANALHGSPYTKLQLLGICNEIEGHPDNLAPALLGGLVASFVEDGRPVAAQYAVHPSLRFTALFPDFELSTHMARSVLPKEIPFADAVFNVSRTAVLLKALEEGNEDLIRTSLHDRLHQPYRSRLIRSYDEVRQLALQSGAVAFCISGAGPTLLYLSTDEAVDLAVAAQLHQLEDNWTLLSLPIDHDGTQVTMA
ncbi:MAG: homoserine kinase [Oscillospiraceae bacterium]|nr:homoserine kinase [Oscillospiraceae bacterium]